MVECLVDRANGIINSDDQPVQVDLKVEPTLHQPPSPSSQLLLHPFSPTLSPPPASLPLPSPSLSSPFLPFSVTLSPTHPPTHPNRSMANSEK